MMGRDAIDGISPYLSSLSDTAVIRRYAAIGRQAVGKIDQRCGLRLGALVRYFAPGLCDIYVPCSHRASCDPSLTDRQRPVGLRCNDDGVIAGKPGVLASLMTET